MGLGWGPPLLHGLDPSFCRLAETLAPAPGWPGEPGDSLNLTFLIGNMGVIMVSWPGAKGEMRSE